MSVMEAFVNNDIGCSSLNVIFPATSEMTCIPTMQNLRAQLSTRPNALSVNEWVINLTTTNEVLAALSQELRLSPQEIKNMFIATVNSATWTAENANFR